jgi:hypothetical protein
MQLSNSARQLALIKPAPRLPVLPKLPIVCALCRLQNGEKRPHWSSLVCFGHFFLLQMDDCVDNKWSRF